MVRPMALHALLCHTPLSAIRVRPAHTADVRPRGLREFLSQKESSGSGLVRRKLLSFERSHGC
jgi:hypothetical protein